MDCQQLDTLVKQFKQHTPHVQPIWDLTINSVAQNDICSEIVKSGLIILSAPFDDVWAGIYEPSIYDSDTLWHQCHDRNKIAMVIDHWARGDALSPIFLVKHGREDLGLVADGKHRLTVARYMGCNSLPFIVSIPNSQWVMQAIPSAVELARTT